MFVVVIRVTDSYSLSSPHIELYFLKVAIIIIMSSILLTLLDFSGKIIVAF